MEGQLVWVFKPGHKGAGRVQAVTGEVAFVRWLQPGRQPELVPVSWIEPMDEPAVALDSLVVDPGYQRPLREVCTSCMQPIAPGQEWCQTPQCDTDLRDSNNRVPAWWIGEGGTEWAD